MKNVKDLIQEQLKICNKYGVKYNSIHEFHSVLLEEIEETDKAFSYSKKFMEIMWHYIKSDNNLKALEAMKDIEKTLLDTVNEAIQCLAVIEKMKQSKLIQEPEKFDTDIEY